jgi:hypothetical protein
MTQAKTVAVVGLLLLVPAILIVRYMNDFSRLKDVEVGSTPVQPGTISKLVFTNKRSSKVDFVLRCHFKVRSGGAPLFSGVVVLPPNATVEFDVNPDLAGRALPGIIANKSCEAVWQGPFGIERSAWWVSWQYGKPAYKTSFQ